MFATFRKIAVAIMAGALCLGVLSAPPAQAAEVINIKLKKLPRGADLRLPHVEYGRETSTLVDGNTRIRLRGGTPFYGKTRYGYLIGVFHGGTPRLVLLNFNNTQQTVIYEGAFSHVYVSSNGKRVVIDDFSETDTLTVRVIAVPSGRELAHRRFNRREVIGVEGPNVYLNDKFSLRFQHYRPIRWHYPTNKVRPLAKSYITAANFKHGLMAGTGRNDCSVVLRLSAPNRPIWSSCDEQVEAFNPNGRAFATSQSIVKTPTNSHTRIRIRGIGGKPKGTFNLTRYDSAVFYEFESPTRLTFYLDTGGDGRATVRVWPHGANRVMPICHSSSCGPLQLPGQQY